MKGEKFNKINFRLLLSHISFIKQKLKQSFQNEIHFDPPTESLDDILKLKFLIVDYTNKVKDYFKKKKEEWR